MLKNILVAVLAGAAVTSASAGQLNSIGVSLDSLGLGFFVAMQNGVTDRAKQINPNVKVTTVSADFDLNKQFTQIDNFIASKVDLIILNAADPVAVGPAIRRAQAAGIPVIAIDVTAAGANATVQTDNVKAGRVSCEYLSSKLGGKGKVLIMNGPQVSSIKDRVKGCKEALAKGNFEILSDNQNGKSTRDGGLAVAQSLMTRFPAFDGVFTVNDEEAIGTDLAAKQLNRRNFSIVSVDGSPEITQALKAQTLNIASAAQSPYSMAVKAVDIGHEILTTGKDPSNPMVLLEPELITRDNVGSYKGWTGR